MREGEIPGVDGAEIQDAVEALDRLVEEASIPDKISFVHSSSWVSPGTGSL